MSYNYTFFNRKNELEELKSVFTDNIIRQRKHAGYLVQGRKNIGKTRLINEFIKVLDTDIEIHSDIPNFDSEKHVIVYNCSKENYEPYLPFIKITEVIRRKKKLLNIFLKSAQVVLAVFGINDTLNALKDLADSVKGGKAEKNIVKKETKTFNKYRKFIKNRSKRVPLIIFIQNVQWIDEFSLKLLKKLSYDEKSLWGMIILEEDDSGVYNENIQSEVNKMISEGKINRLDVAAMEKSFPAKLMNQRFGEDFITSEENDILYTVSEGSPGMLIDFIEEECIKENWIFQRENEWKKVDDFKDKIKPKFQKLLELIRTTYEDKDISEGELKLIKNMAILWGVPDEEVTETIGMVKDIMNLGFKIIHVLGPGIVSRVSFLASDKKNNRFLIEYLHTKQKTDRIIIKHREIEHKNLLEARDIKLCPGGVVIIWDYVEGKRTRQVLIAAHEIHIKKSVNKIIQICKGLSELHKREEVHGFIKPDSIVETEEGVFRLATFDISLLKYLSNFSELADKENLLYLSPEHLAGDELNAPSDMFSLGVLFFKSLTDRFPFYGSNPQEIRNAVLKNEVPFEGNIISSIPQDIRMIINKCLKYDPNERYTNAEDMLQDLEALRIEPLSQPVEKPVRKEKSVVSSRLIPAAATVTVLALLYFIYSQFLKAPAEKKIVEKDKLTIHCNEIGERSTLNRVISPEVIEYLIMDDISQSSDLSIITENEFDKLYPDTESEDYRPLRSVKASIINKNIGYEYKVAIESSSGAILSEKSFDFNEPISLLNDLTPATTHLIISQFGEKERKKSTFTKDWDAFENFYLGEIAWQKLKKNEAKQKFLAALSIDPEFVLAKLRLVEVFRFEGTNSEALNLLESVKPYLGELSSVDSLRWYALNSGLTGDLREAINYYKQIIEKQPMRKESAYETAEAYFNLREIENAIIYYRQALSIDPEFSPAINHLGYCYSHLGQHDLALKNFRKYVNLDSSANSYDSMGDGYLAAGELDSAAIAKKKGISLEPNLEYLYSTLSYINMRNGMLAEAGKNIDKYMALTDSNAEMISSGYFYYALMNYSKGDFSRAIDSGRKSIQIFDSRSLASRNHDLHWLMGVLYNKMKKRSDFLSEISEMEQIIITNNVNATNYNSVLKYYLHLKGIQFANQGDLNSLDEIVETFNGPLSTKIKDHGSPFDPAYFNNEFGELYFELNNYKEAERQFNRALAYNPNFAITHYNLWKLYEVLQREKESLKFKDSFSAIWKNADTVVKTRYGI